MIVDSLSLPFPLLLSSSSLSSTGSRRHFRGAGARVVRPEAPFLLVKSTTSPRGILRVPVCDCHLSASLPSFFLRKVPNATAALIHFRIPFFLFFIGISFLSLSQLALSASEPFSCPPPHHLPRRSRFGLPQRQLFFCTPSTFLNSVEQPDTTPS